MSENLRTDGHIACAYCPTTAPGGDLPPRWRLSKDGRAACPRCAQLRKSTMADPLPGSPSVASPSPTQARSEPAPARAAVARPAEKAPVPRPHTGAGTSAPRWEP